MKNDLHALFEHREKTNFHDSIKIKESSKAKLRSAAHEIVAAIKSGFKSDSKLLAESLPFKVPTPYFAIQGSYSYGTLIEPAFESQQIDFDLGLYLPFAALGKMSKDDSVIQAYFSVVESCLQEHIESKGRPWKLLKGRGKKDTCVRVVLDKSSHIDIPLYGYPEAYAQEMGRASLVNDSMVLNESTQIDSIYTFDRLMESKIGIHPTQIHFADREKGWVASNAIVLGKAIKMSLKNLGAESRAIARYVKSWRDHQWSDGGGPSSLYLLMLTIESINSVTTRHCELLSLVAKKTESVLDKPLLVPCPTEQDPEHYEDLNDRIQDTDREIFRAAFLEFRQIFSESKLDNQPSIANKKLITLFGERMPYDPSRIKKLDRSALAAEKAVLAAPIVTRSTHPPKVTTGG